MKVAFFDIDGTLIADFSGVSFLAFLAEKGKFKKENKERLLEITEKYKNGKATYEQFAESWGQEISAGLKGQKQIDISGLTNEFWKQIHPKVAFWAKDVISHFNNSGFATIAISGSPIELLNLYKEKLGFQEVYATKVEVIDGIYTDKVIINTVLVEEKGIIVDEIIAKDHVDLMASYGFGDNEHDRAFLDKVGHPIAISSESSLKHYAKEQGWPVFNFDDNVFEEVKALLQK